MSSVLFPDKEYNSIHDIPFKELYDQGYRGIILDIDNTVVEHGAPADEKAIEFFNKLRSLGFKTYILSNNKEQRASGFAQAVGSPFIARANKPLPGNYRFAAQEMGCTAENTIFIGDQIFTDISGAKLAGIKAFLVKPIYRDPEIQIVIKRFFEKIVLYFYHHSKSCDKS